MKVLRAVHVILLYAVIVAAAYTIHLQSLTIVQQGIILQFLLQPSGDKHA